MVHWIRRSPPGGMACRSGFILSKDEIAHACPISCGADFDENHHFIHRKMAKHSKFAMGEILMKIVILSCRLGGILFRLENAPGCAPIS